MEEGVTMSVSLMDKRKNSIISHVCITVSILVILILARNLGALDDTKGAVYIILSLLVILSIFNLGILLYLIRSLRKEKELEMIKSDLKNTEALIDLLRKQGHDHINNIQTVTSMLILEEYDVAKDYLQGIANNYRFTGHFLRLGNPSLTAIVNTKKELANQKGIEFIIQKYCRVKLRNIAPWDLANIAGNLIDNAMEHVLTHKELPQRVSFFLENRDDLKGYIFRVSNPYQGDRKDFENFFAQGFSSKASTGRGYGLSIVKDLVEQYSGRIDVFQDEDNITFQVELRD